MQPFRQERTCPACSPGRSAIHQGGSCRRFTQRRVARRPARMQDCVSTTVCGTEHRTGRRNRNALRDPSKMKPGRLTPERVLVSSSSSQKKLREAGTAHDQQCAEHELALHAEMHHGKMTAQPTPASPWRCLLVLTSSLKTSASTDVECCRQPVTSFVNALEPKWYCTKKPCWTFLWD